MSRPTSARWRCLMKCRGWSLFLTGSLVLVLSSTACYHATIETGAQPSTRTVDQNWAASFLYGLVPPSPMNAASRCPNGVARIETQHSFLNMLAASGTLGIYTPIQINVTCASGPRTSENSSPTVRPFAKAASTPTEPAPATAAPERSCATGVANGTTRHFSSGDLTGGVVLGLSGLSEATMGGGVRVEKALQAMPSLGCGVLAVEGFYDAARGSLSFSLGSSTITETRRYSRPGVALNYHIRVADERLDPFAGIAVGHSTYSIDSNSSGNGSNFSQDNFFTQLHVGVRYFANDYLAYHAESNPLSGSLNLGVMYRP